MKMYAPFRTHLVVSHSLDQKHCQPILTSYGACVVVHARAPGNVFAASRPMMEFMGELLPISLSP
ncbi:hypothetical protein P692DRAFT_20824360 [Suillus brevipes Sb2]|nr:hypothetical protein P692DRAFT_20824360 [Suillus brevipes Sb2]